MHLPVFNQYPFQVKLSQIKIFIINRNHHCIPYQLYKLHFQRGFILTLQEIFKVKILIACLFMELDFIKLFKFIDLLLNLNFSYEHIILLDLNTQNMVIILNIQMTIFYYRHYYFSFIHNDYFMFHLLLKSQNYDINIFHIIILLCE